MINCVPKQEIKPVRHLLDPNPKKESQVLSVNMRKTFHKSEKKDVKNSRLRGSSFRIKNTPKIV